MSTIDSLEMHELKLPFPPDYRNVPSPQEQCQVSYGASADFCGVGMLVAQQDKIIFLEC